MELPQATSASQGSRLTGNYWDRFLPPPSPSSTSTAAAASVASAAPAAANAAAPAPAPTSTSTGESSSSSEPMSIFSGGGLSSWLDLRGIQRDLMATGGGGGSSRGEASAASGSSGDAAAPPQTVEALMQSFRAHVGRGASGEGSSAAASGAALPEHPGGHPPRLLSAAGNTHGISQQQQHGTVAAAVPKAARDGGVDGATAANPGAGQQWRPEVPMRRGTSESASAAGGLDGYLLELPESEDEQLRLAIALSLRSSSSGGGRGGGDGGNDSRNAAGGVAASAITTGDPLAGGSRGSVRNLSLGAGGSASRTVMGSGAAGDSKARAGGPGDGDDRLEVEGLCSITTEGKGVSYGRGLRVCSNSRPFPRPDSTWC